MGSATIVILGMVVIAIVIVLANRSMHRREAERAEEYRKAAALRGWQMDFDGTDYRYSGATEGVRWVARVGHFRRRPGRNNQPKPLRWETAEVRFDDGALVIWPNFGPGIKAIRTPGVPEFVLNLAMRPVAWALGASGDDAAILASASEPVEGPERYLFRATHPEPMREWLNKGAEHTLQSEAKWLADKDAPHHLIIAVLWKHGLQIATPYGTNDLEQIERVTRVGVRLAKAT
jgi:hypothetical protein